MTISPDNAYRYQAFISYSHAADGRLAPALQSALQQILKPWYRMRFMRVFRDETGLAVTPELWGSIRQAMDRSEYFILLASPAAAKSAWVAQELRHWLQHRVPENLLIVCTEGTIVWNRATGDFDWDKTDALPRCLEKAFKEEPNYGDLVWARDATKLSLRHPRFFEQVSKLTSTILKQPLEEIFEAADQQHQKTRRLLYAAVFALTVLTGVSAASAYLSLQARRSNERREQAEKAALQRQLEETNRWILQQTKQKQLESERLRRSSLANRWAQSALALLAEDRQLSLLLALEAVKQEPTPEAENALRRALLDLVPPLVLRGHSRGIHHVEFSPDGHRVLTSSADGTVRLWDAATGTNLWVVTPQGKTDHADSAQGTFSQDGRRVLTFKRMPEHAPWLSGSDRVELRDGVTGGIINTISNRSIFHAALSPDGRQIVTADGSSVRVWEAERGQVQFELPGHTFHVVSAMFSSSGKWIVTGSWDGTARVWDAATGRNLGVIPAPTNVNWAAFTPDGTRLLTLSDNHKDLRLWDWSGSPGASLHPFGGPQPAILDLAFSRDGKWLVTGSHDGTARIWEMATGRCLPVLNAHEGPVQGVAFSSDGRWVVTAGSDQTARLWDATKGTELCQLGWNFSSRTCVAFSPNGKQIATGTASGDVPLYTCEVCGSVEELQKLARDRARRELTKEEREKYLLPVP